jgi:hypothetical protein
MRLIAVWMTALALLSAQSGTPRWSAIPDICAGRRAAGWTLDDPLGGNRPGQARVGGRLRIDLCRAERPLPPAARGTAPRLTLFLQYRGGSSMSLAGEFWNEADRSSLLAALRAEFDRLARELRLTVSSDLATAVSTADTWEDEAPGVSYRVSTETRASALISQPDLKPDQVPLFRVEIVVAEEP